MRQVNTQLLAEQKPLGVIDSLTAGFETVRKRPWTLLAPILIDLIIWFLPKLSLSTLVRRSLDRIVSLGGPAANSTDILQSKDVAIQIFGSINLLELVSAALNAVTRWPSLLTWPSASPIAGDGPDIHSPINALAYTFQLNSFALVVLLFVPLFLLGLFIASAYIELVAQGVRPLGGVLTTPSAALGRIGAMWLRLVGFSIGLGLVVATGLVFSLLGAALTNGGDAASFLVSLILVGLLWLFIYLFFTISAMAVSSLGLVAAMQRSIRLFREQFWSSLGLLVLIVLLDRGLSLIWYGLAVTPLGVLLAIMANAFIGTSLLAASMVYYQDRLAWMDRARTRARAPGR